MPFTYDITTARGKVRFEVGDTTAATALFDDAEVDLKLTEHSGDVLLTAAALCDVLATRFAGRYDIEADGQAMKRSQAGEAYAERAAVLRARTNGSLGAIEHVRVDGVSDELSGRDGAGRGAAPAATGRTRRGWYGDDLF